MVSIYLEEIDSTNSYLKRNYKLIEDGTFVYTDYQSAGKGRSGRNWQSEKGNNLLFSLLIKNEKLLEKYKELSVVSALSVIQVLQKYQISNLGLKWPNDVYVDGKKIAGILLEGVSTDKLECLIIGIGINVNQSVFENDLKIPAQSVRNCLDREIDLAKFRKEIFSNISDNLNKLTDGYDFYNEVIQYDYLKGKRVSAVIAGEKKIVTVNGINRDYSLAVTSDDGDKNLESGEISFHL